MSEPGSWAEAREQIDGSAESLRKSADALRERVSREVSILCKEALGGLTEVITWIPVSERLPDTDRMVNVWLGIGAVGARYVLANREYECPADGWYDDHYNRLRVKYWAEQLRGPRE